MISLNILGCMYFLTHKDDTLKIFEKIWKRVQNKKELKILSIRNGHGGELENKKFESFCENYGITHSFSCLRTPQQNVVVERKCGSWKKE